MQNIKSIIWLVIASIMVACGGGGGSQSDSSNNDITNNTGTPSVDQVTAPVNYDPDIEKKTAAAQSSNDLYVEPDFNFDTSSKVLFTFSLENSTRDSTIVKVYRIIEEQDATSLSSNNDEEDLSAKMHDSEKELLFIQHVGANHYAEVQQDIPPNTHVIVAVANIIGRNNIQYQDINSDIINVTF